MTLHRVDAPNTNADPSSVAASRAVLAVDANPSSLTDRKGTNAVRPAKLASDAMTVASERRRLVVEIRFLNEMFGWY